MNDPVRRIAGVDISLEEGAYLASRTGRRTRAVLGPLFMGWLVSWLVMAAAPPVQSAPAPDGITVGSEDELARLPGQRVRVLEDEPATVDGTRSHHSYVIEDIAGEGAPWIGRVRVHGERLALETRDGLVLPLTGPLARKRIAGPGYKVWIIGELRGRPAELFARRIGVLAPP